MTSWRDAIPLGAWPRRLPQKMAAAYLGISVGTFLARVKEGRYPAAAESDPPRWDRAQLDRQLDQEVGLAAPFKSNEHWLGMLDADHEDPRRQ